WGKHNAAAQTHSPQAQSFSVLHCFLPSLASFSQKTFPGRVVFCQYLRATVAVVARSRCGYDGLNLVWNYFHVTVENGHRIDPAIDNRLFSPVAPRQCTNIFAG